jgi:sec-independent protein translocase protein TatC
MSGSQIEERDPSPHMTFWEHTAELSRRLKIVLYSVVAFTGLMMVLPANLDFLKNPLEFYDPLVGVVLRTIKDQILPSNIRLISIELAAPIELYVIASAVFGVAFSMPVLAYEAYKFIDPALYPHERKDLYPFVISFSILFLLGAAFGYGIVTHLIIRALIPFYAVVGAEAIMSIIDFYNMVFIITLLSGFSFTTPLFFVLLVKYNILSTSIVTRNRQYIYGATYVVCAMITPDGGPGSLIMMMPLVVLTELGVLVAKRYEKNRTSPPRIRLFEPKICRFCRKEMNFEASFCDKCGKAQR